MKQDKYFDIVCLEDELGEALEALNEALEDTAGARQAAADEAGMGESFRHMAAARNAAMLAGANMLAQLLMRARRPGTPFEAERGDAADRAHRAFADEARDMLLAMLEEARNEMKEAGR